MELKGKIRATSGVSKKTGKPFKAIVVTLPTIDNKVMDFYIFPKTFADWRILGIDPQDERYFAD